MITVKDLIDKGAIKAPVTVYGEYRGHKIEAEITADGAFRIGNDIYSSPSVAAGKAVTSTTGMRTPSRSYLSVNGWKFWMVSASSSLADVRNSLNNSEEG